MTPVVRLDAPPAQAAAPPVAPAVAAASAAVAEVEAERAALSRLLHDDILQSLIAARYTAELSGAPEVVAAVRGAIAEAREAMWRLRPRTDDGRLLDALDDLAAHRSDLVIALHTTGVPERVDPAAATVAFRVVQAAVALCGAATVRIRVAVRAGVLTVAMCDDGPAYDDAAYTPGSDLTRWLSRAGALGGVARIGDSRSGGTTLWLEIPNALPTEGDR